MYYWSRRVEPSGAGCLLRASAGWLCLPSSGFSRKHSLPWQSGLGRNLALHAIVWTQYEQDSSVPLAKKRTLYLKR